jgi:hypothetical protein
VFVVHDDSSEMLNRHPDRTTRTHHNVHATNRTRPLIGHYSYRQTVPSKATRNITRTRNGGSDHEQRSSLGERREER